MTAPATDDAVKDGLEIIVNQVRENSQRVLETQGELLKKLSVNVDRILDLVRTCDDPDDIDRALDELSEISALLWRLAEVCEHAVMTTEAKTIAPEKDAVHFHEQSQSRGIRPWPAASKTSPSSSRPKRRPKC
jgi:hypothetical protein